MKLNAIQAELYNAHKQEKSKMYQIEKEDIFLMEKGKFLQERQREMNAHRKKANTSADKHKIEQQIRELLSAMNSVLSERNRTEQ